MGRFIVLVTLVCITSLIHAQRVSNVTVIQEGQKLHIRYELISASPVEVGLFISENNGGTWTKVSEHVSGDVGPKVSGGSKEMVWDVLQARESLVGNSIVFKVKAGSEIKSVKIGNQVWMAENLNVDHYRNGDPIPTGLSKAQWQSTTNGAYAIYNDDPANEKVYGKLYNWYAVSDSRGLCPTGWHVPSNDDWIVLEYQFGGRLVAGKSLKSGHGWYGLDSESSNESNFSGLPGGGRLLDGNFYADGRFGFWGSSTQYDFSRIWARRLNYDDSSVYRDVDVQKYFGLSVSCIKD